jgi:anti-sigma B factor antagonist
MQLILEPRGTYTLVRPDFNRLDASAAPVLRSATADLVNQGNLRVVLDLGGVGFVDSSGLGALIHLHKTLEGRGRLALCRLDPKVLQLLKVTRLERVLAIAASEEEAAKLVQG